MGMSTFNALEAIEHFKAANAELREELRQAYALGIYKGSDGLLRNSWQQRVEELERENKRLQDLLDMANYALWQDRM